MQFSRDTGEWIHDPIPSNEVGPYAFADASDGLNLGIRAMHLKTLLFTTTLAGVAAAWPISVLAAAAETSQLDEVVVTGSRGQVTYRDFQPSTDRRDRQ